MSDENKGVVHSTDSQKLVIIADAFGSAISEIMSMESIADKIKDSILKRITKDRLNSACWVFGVIRRWIIKQSKQAEQEENKNESKS